MATNLLTPPLTVFEHMALDETLVHAYQEPVVRFYHWAPGPAVTFGYAQFYQAVRQQTTAEQGPLCRRPTGGGIVFHGEDLTFSLVFESNLTRPRDIYAKLHGAIEQALAQQGVLNSTRQPAVSAAQYAPMQQQTASGCFANPVEDDLLFGGRKILGGAIRRFGKIVLYQGSLQCEQARTNPVFRRAVSSGAAAMLDVDFQTVPVSAGLLQQALQLAKQQYQQESWNKKF